MSTCANRAEKERKRLPRALAQQRPAVALFDLRPAVLDQLAVLDAGGAGRLAGPTVQALVNVPDIPLTGQKPKLFHVEHLANPPPGGVGLESP